MGGFFGVASRKDCVLDLFYGIDYHSHLGTRRAGMAVCDHGEFQRAIHNIENSPFRTKFERDAEEMRGNIGIGCISDYEPQPLLIQSHLGSFAITTVGKINNLNSLSILINNLCPPILFKFKLFLILEENLLKEELPIAIWDEKTPKIKHVVVNTFSKSK